MGGVYWSVEAGGTRKVANMLIVNFSLLLWRFDHAKYVPPPQWLACLGCSLWGGVTMASVIAFNTILVSQLQVAD